MLRRMFAEPLSERQRRIVAAVFAAVSLCLCAQTAVIAGAGTPADDSAAQEGYYGWNGTVTDLGACYYSWAHDGCYSNGFTKEAHSKCIEAYPDGHHVKAWVRGTWTWELGKGFYWKCRAAIPRDDSSLNIDMSSSTTFHNGTISPGQTPPPDPN